MRNRFTLSVKNNSVQFIRGLTNSMVFDLRQTCVNVLASGAMNSLYFPSTIDIDRYPNSIVYPQGSGGHVTHRNLSHSTRGLPYTALLFQVRCAVESSIDRISFKISITGYRYGCTNSYR